MRRTEILRNFIVFEGLDGAGTTTQTKLLLDRFGREGLAAASTNEPTSGPIGRMIRAFLKGAEAFDPATAAFLFAADRNEHIYGPSGVAKTASREIVISDRYFFSSLAYQSLDCDYGLVSDLNSRFPLPEFLFFLEVDPETADARLASRESREVYERLEIQRKVRAKYHEVLSSYRSSAMHVLVIDGTKPPETVHEEVWSFFRSFR